MVLVVVAVTGIGGGYWYLRHVRTQKTLFSLSYPIHRQMLIREITSRIRCEATNPGSACTDGAPIDIKEEGGGIYVPKEGKTFGNVVTKAVCESGGVTVRMMEKGKNTSWDDPEASVPDLTGLCDAESPQVKYGGVFSKFIDDVCITPNLQTGTCSCPAGYSAQGIFHFVPQCTKGWHPGHRGMHQNRVEVCGFYTMLCLAKVGA